MVTGERDGEERRSSGTERSDGVLVLRWRARKTNWGEELGNGKFTCVVQLMRPLKICTLLNTFLHKPKLFMHPTKHELKW
jgi:hypothetical protein